MDHQHVDQVAEAEVRKVVGGRLQEYVDNRQVSLQFDKFNFKNIGLFFLIIYNQID